MKFEFEGTLAEFQALFIGSKPARSVAPVAVPEPVFVPAPEAHVVPDQTDPAQAELPTPPPALQSVMPPPAPIPALAAPSRSEGWRYFVDFCKKWMEGFEVLGAPQPDRPQMMRDLGCSRAARAVMILALEMKSLQRLVEKALLEIGFKKQWEEQWQAEKGSPATGKDWQDFYDRVAGTMVQISHVGFPDLDGMYDYSSAWRK